MTGIGKANQDQVFTFLPQIQESDCSTHCITAVSPSTLEHYQSELYPPFLLTVVPSHTSTPNQYTRHYTQHVLFRI